MIRIACAVNDGALARQPHRAPRQRNRHPSPIVPIASPQPPSRAFVRLASERWMFFLPTSKIVWLLGYYSSSKSSSNQSSSSTTTFFLGGTASVAVVMFRSLSISTFFDADATLSTGIERVSATPGGPSIPHSTSYSFGKPRSCAKLAASKCLDNTSQSIASAPATSPPFESTPRSRSIFLNASIVQFTSKYVESLFCRGKHASDASRNNN